MKYQIFKKVTTISNYGEVEADSYAGARTQAMGIVLRAKTRPPSRFYDSQLTLSRVQARARVRAGASRRSLLDQRRPRS